MSSHSAQNLHWYREPASASADTYVLLHGFAGGWQSWKDVARALPAEAGVLAIVLPGHELVRASPSSAVDDRPAPVRFRVFDDVARWVASVVPAKSHLVGYSAGGRVALASAAYNLDCARLTLVSSSHAGLVEPERTAREVSDAAWSSLLRTRGIAAFVEAWEAQPIFASQARASEALRAAQTSHRLGLDPFALADAMDTLSVAAMPDLSPTLSTLTVPLQLIAGADDAKYVASASRAARVALDARVAIIPGCGHNPLLEAPEALAELLRNFRTSGR